MDGMYMGRVHTDADMQEDIHPSYTDVYTHQHAKGVYKETHARTNEIPNVHLKPTFIHITTDKERG